MAGSRGGVAGPIKLRNPGMLLDVRLQPGASFTQVGGGGASWRGCPCCSSSRRAWQAFAVRLLRSSLCALRMLLVRAHRACHLSDCRCYGTHGAAGAVAEILALNLLTLPCPPFPLCSMCPRPGTALLMCTRAKAVSATRMRRQGTTMCRQAAACAWIGFQAVAAACKRMWLLLLAARKAPCAPRPLRAMLPCCCAGGACLRAAQRGRHGERRLLPAGWAAPGAGPCSCCAYLPACLHECMCPSPAPPAQPPPLTCLTSNPQC